MQTATSETESKSLDLSICVHHYTLRAPCPKGQGIFWLNGWLKQFRTVDHPSWHRRHRPKLERQQYSRSARSGFAEPAHIAAETLFSIHRRTRCALNGSQMVRNRRCWVCSKLGGARLRLSPSSFESGIQRQRARWTPRRMNERQEWQAGLRRARFSHMPPPLPRPSGILRARR